MRVAVLLVVVGVGCSNSTEVPYRCGLAVLRTVEVNPPARACIDGGSKLPVGDCVQYCDTGVAECTLYCPNDPVGCGVSGAGGGPCRLPMSVACSFTQCPL
jgi:hypothetical protein